MRVWSGQLVGAVEVAGCDEDWVGIVWKDVIVHGSREDVVEVFT